MTQQLLPEEKHRFNKLPKLSHVSLSYFPMYHNLNKGRTYIFVASAGEIAMKAVGRMADILTVIGQIIFNIYPRKDLTKY